MYSLGNSNSTSKQDCQTESESFQVMRRPTADPDIITDQDDIHSIILREFYSLWNETRVDMPGPVSLDIVAIPAVVPFVAIARIEGEPTLRNAIVIYAGSEIVSTAAIDPTGMRISELQNFPNMLLLADRCLETRVAMKLGPTKVANQRNEFMDVELVMLPLFKDGVTLSGLVYGVAYMRV